MERNWRWPGGSSNLRVCLGCTLSWCKAAAGRRCLLTGYAASRLPSGLLIRSVSDGAGSGCCCCCVKFRRMNCKVVFTCIYILRTCVSVGLKLQQVRIILEEADKQGFREVVLVVSWEE